MQAEQLAEDVERVVVVNSEEELDSKLKADAAKLLVLLSTVTWCRPCKSLKRPLEVIFWLGCNLQTARSAGLQSRLQRAMGSSPKVANSFFLSTRDCRLL